MEIAPERDGRHDFDFFFGEWRVDNRRLLARHAGSQTWDHFPGRCVVRPILGGLGNTDEIEFPTRGFSGATLRLFDRRAGEWRLFWTSDRDGVLLPPVSGRFEAGVGVFYGDDVDGERPVRVRYIWSNITEGTARWEQAFSIDRGRTWETNWTMEMTRAGATPAAPGDGPRSCCPVIELRRYAMKPGRRDELIALFERRFLDGQERYGMRVIGQFANEADPDAFVWLRGFADMDARRSALEGFYGGPIWADHGPAANDTMEDSSNVLLLRPVRAASGFRLSPAAPSGGTAGLAGAPDRADTDGDRGFVLATIYSLAAPADSAFLRLFETGIAPALRAAGATLLGAFVTEQATNTFPRLPVREGESVFVWIASFADARARRAFDASLGSSREWTTVLRPALERYLSRPEEALALTPTSRSRLRHRA